MNMKLLRFALLLLVAFVVVNVTCADISATSDDDSQVIIESARARFRLPQLFSFSSFKDKFKKRYASVVEELVRKKLFLARTFKAFISSIGYKHKKASSYLSVNQMSDWTDAEWRSTLIKPEVYYKNLEDLPVTEDMAENLQRLTDKENEGEQSDETPLVDTDDIKRKFSEIVDNPNSKPGYNEIADELLHPKQEANIQLPVDITDELVEVDDVRASSGRSFNFQYVKDRVKESFWSTLIYLDRTIGNAFVWFNVDVPARRVDLPDEVFIDHRDSNCLNSIRDQGNCGSCYIFSVTAYYEWAFCRAYGSKVKFSEQYVIDCGWRIGLGGCNGGVERHVGRFVEKFGFELLDRYMYKATDQQCPYTEDDFNTDKTGLLRLDKPRMRFVPYKRLEEQLRKSPVLMVVHTGDDFLQYGGGVHLNDKCQYSDGFHSMLVVGSGRQDGLEYWLMRNSHGVYWGERGYYKMQKGSKCLGVLGYGFTLEVFRPDRLPDSIGDSLPPLINLYESDQVKEYNFTANPKYDWNILAKRFSHRFPPQIPDYLKKAAN